MCGIVGISRGIVPGMGIVRGLHANSLVNLLAFHNSA